MNNLISGHTLRFVILVLLQALILNHINFLGYINPYLYILFIALYPIKNNRFLFLFLSFLLGLFVDIFSDSGGIHAAAALTAAYTRPIILKFSFGAAYEHQTIRFNTIEFGALLVYLITLTLIHHLVVFSLEVFNIKNILLILKKTLFSSIFTIILTVLTIIIFSRKR
ncbi:rod shape-determining protein MreD [Mangrovimonas spongiae]|uniref:Rod shape-determining protein MreD n=1 Tax=Mangrovimonas spongiae TaxID=2494697 RepID=A0A3R9UTS0_9FLAO|nr:rod shape-determining protein MreD [Mangrovimonas spongiae]RSK39936.1 rod shape-determining protein MreD [Mangrovimonas spongiae]